MQHKNFVITAIRIYPESNDRYKKNLKFESYKFNQLDLANDPKLRPLEREFFGKGIFIQTIVGKNGSGKSSIMELLYRIINNFSYYILKYTKPKRISAEPIYLIEELYADLEFIIDDELSTVQVRNKSLALINEKEKIFFGPLIKEFTGFKDFNKVNKENIVKKASSLFYTIVTNYSFQSLISRDFSDDIAHEFVGSKTEGVSSRGNWLDSLFRKNDGYTTPIVLNPYREDGVVNLQREFDLTLSRIAGLLIQAKQSNREFLEGYNLSTISYEIRHEHFLHKFFKKYNPKDDELYITKLRDAVIKRGSVANAIVLAYDLDTSELYSEVSIIPYAYLVYKTLNVIHKYAQFETFDDIPQVTNFSQNITPNQTYGLTAAIQQIKKDRSHVNLKIFQTLNFLSGDQQQVEKFRLEEYGPYISTKKFRNLDDILEKLPPPFCTQKIFLTKKGGDKDISLESLSSGERQFIYTVSTLVYHTKNLLSIQRANRIRYRNVNLVLDEVEICFHPEYQRQFIQNLLDLFERLKLTRNCSFNIFIITHSPFILSDIPKNNILYLKDGKQINDEDFINPLAANINDILYQSFFLEGGFIGEHAKNKIDSALKELELDAIGEKKDDKIARKHRNWTKESMKQLIDMIGEPLIKDNLFDLYLKAYEQQNYEDILKQKDQEILRLTKMLNEKSDNL